MDKFFRHLISRDTIVEHLHVFTILISLLGKDVTQYLLSSWILLHCQFQHKEMTNIVLALRHLEPAGLFPVILLKCKYCGANEYYSMLWLVFQNILCPNPAITLTHKNKTLYFKCLQKIYSYYYDGGCPEYESETKHYTFDQLMKMFGDRPLQWNPYESCLLPWYRTITFEQPFEEIISKKRKALYDLNEKQKLRKLK